MSGHRVGFCVYVYYKCPNALLGDAVRVSEQLVTHALSDFELPLPGGKVMQRVEFSPIENTTSDGLKSASSTLATVMEVLEDFSPATDMGSVVQRLEALWSTLSTSPALSQIQRHYEVFSLAVGNKAEGDR